MQDLPGPGRAWRRREGPALVAAALVAFGRSPADVDSAHPDAQLLRQLLGATSSQLQGVFGLRNRVGTGHGRAGDVPVDEPLVRLAIGQALVAATYLLQVHADTPRTGSGGPGIA